jgi:hypothetical protein
MHETRENTNKEKEAKETQDLRRGISKEKMKTGKKKYRIEEEA